MINQLKFLLVPEASCVYLPDRNAANLFLQPDAPIDTALYAHLINFGFRRSGDFVYRPYCGRCRSCIPVRIPVHDFKPNRTQNRVKKMNAQLTVEEQPMVLTDEQFDLYARYVNSRHEGSSMAAPDLTKTEDFFTSFWCNTRFFEFRENGELIMVAIVDQFSDSFSAVYTFFEPNLHKRSLGVYGILWEIEKCKTMGFPYLHLGFWVNHCQKMHYKNQYRPLELLIGDQQWHRLEKNDTFSESTLQPTRFDHTQHTIEVIT